MSTQRRTRRDPEASRAHILEAATAVFAEVGPDAAGLKEVAARAGVSHGLITHYFGTFDNLVEQVLQVSMQTLRDQLIGSVRPGTPLDVDHLLREALSVFLQPQTGRIMAWAFLSGRMDASDFHARRAQGMKRLVDAVVGATDASRANVEETVLIAWSAIASYSVARQVLWSSLGQEHRAEHDERFVAALAETLTTRLSR